MDFSQLSEENHDIELSKVFEKFDKLIFPKELKKVKQENESLIVQLSESHALIDSLRFENTMLFNIIDTIENKLKESEDLLKNFSSDNLKSMLCIHSDISNKPASIVDMTTSTSHALNDSLRSENTMLFNIIDTLENKLKESEDLLKNFSSDNLKSMLCIHSDISNKPASIVDMSTSTSHASDSEIDSIDIKPVIVDTTCLENSCLTNHVMPKSKDTRTQAHGKFVPTCHNCGKIGHIRPNYYLLRSHRPWIKQDAFRKRS
jgi:hypothetical protein